MPPVPRFGAVELYQENGTAAAVTFAARFSCSPGYSLAGSGTSRCHANSRWDFSM
jgi:hypothetical protein